MRGEYVAEMSKQLYHMPMNSLDSGDLPLENTIVLIAGASGSGKSTVARATREARDDILVVHFDDFQYNPELLEADEDGYKNWDDPSFTDFNFAHSSIERLKNNRAITLMAKNEFDNPGYIRGDYRRTPIKIVPGKICVIEGHYALLDQAIIDLASITIFLEIEPDKAFRRRTKMSTEVYDMRYLIPMHEKYVLQTEKRAQHVINITDQNEIAVRDKILEIIEEVVPS
jgi:uridine kinase